MTTFTGTVAIRAMKDNDYQATIYPGTRDGLQSAIDSLRATGGTVHIGPGTLALGSSGIAVTGMSTSLSIELKGSSERATIISYSGSGDALANGADDGNHSGVANAYNGTGCQLKISDLAFVGPGIGAGRAVVDWENGSCTYERVRFNGFLVGYYGIGADVVSFRDCSFNFCGKGAFLASRCDQNTFDACYFTSNTIGANVEYAWGSRFFGCQFVFNTTADIVYDAPASPTDGGDERLDIASTVQGCWFESASGATLPRHIWIGSNGTSTRHLEGFLIQGGYVLASNTTNIVDVQAASAVTIEDVYQGGTITGALCYLVSVAGLSQATIVRDCRVNGGTFYGGTLGATQQLIYRQRNTSSNAFAASFTPNALGGEILEMGVLTADITINAPTNPNRGQFLLFRFQQDSTGGRTVTWNSVFKHSWTDVGNNVPTADASIRFWYDGTNWRQMGAQRGWTDTANRSTLPIIKGSNIASGATITLASGNVFTITGTADITSITATTEDTGRVVWLIFSGTAATTGVTDGSNLKLSANFGYTPDDTMCLVCDGTNWYEVTRSVN